jgi:hypothetical protein
MTKKSRTVLKYIIFVIVFQIYSSCKNKEQAFNGMVYRYGNKNYGYTISFNQKVIIRQERIPALEGEVTFKDSIDALKVMDLVIEKLNKGKNPAVNKSELRKLNIKI